jgi:hypothetical protein
MAGRAAVLVIRLGQCRAGDHDSWRLRRVAKELRGGEALALIERERCSVYYGMSNMAWALLELPGWDSNERIGSYLEGRRCSGLVYLPTGWPKTTHEGGYASDQTLMPCRPHRWQWDICAYQPTPSSSKPSCAISSRQSGQSGGTVRDSRADELRCVRRGPTLRDQTLSAAKVRRRRLRRGRQ